MPATRDPARGALVAVLILTAVFTPAVAGEWPRFRGPAADGVSAETKLAAAWPEQGPAVLWRASLGSGYSGLSVAGGRVYTMFGSGDSEFVVALGAADGKEVWRFRIDKLWRDRQGDGPRSTPTLHDGTLYAVSAGGRLVALDAKDGRSLWQRELREDFGARIPRWGFSASPVIEGKLLLLEVGGPGALIVGLDRKSGREVWRAGDGKAGYSTPLVATLGGVRQAVFFSAKGIVAVSPSDGALLWTRPWETSWDVNAAMPVQVSPETLFISSGYDVGAALLRVRAGEGKIQVEEVWRNREMKNQFSSSVLHAGQLYGFDDRTLKCIDVATGELRWRARDFGHGSLIRAGRRLFVLGDNGLLALVEATPEEYREKGRMRPFDGKTWTAPALAGGRLYLRDENAVIALDVSG